jgi:hypothetical protein
MMRGVWGGVVANSVDAPFYSEPIDARRVSEAEAVEAVVKLRLSASMKQGTMILGLVALNVAAVYADDVPASASRTEQAQARQFGIYFGGMASQYDLCVKKGFLPKGDQSAEQMARSILEKMRQFDTGSDQSAFVQDGWDAIKLEIAKHESEYTQEKCSWVATEWAKMVATMTPK